MGSSLSTWSSKSDVTADRTLFLSRRAENWADGLMLILICFYLYQLIKGEYRLLDHHDASTQTDLTINPYY